MMLLSRYLHRATYGNATMKRSRNILAAGIFCVAAVSLMPAAASAEPWGHDQWGTNMRAQNCDCSDAPAAAAPARQAPVPMAKQTGPRGEPDRAGTVPQQR
jgi:hypothetical protein